jgi:hypothetical protein
VEGEPPGEPFFQGQESDQGAAPLLTRGLGRPFGP